MTTIYSKPLEKISVVTTIAPLAYFAERVGGDDVSTEVMIPSGVCLESFEPKLNQIKITSKANIYIKVGHPGYSFENRWLEALLSNTPHVRVIDLYKVLYQGNKQDKDAGGLDPHIWLSVSAARALVHSIESALVEIRPTREDYFKRNVLALMVEIDNLDKELNEKFSNDRGKAFLVYHPAWGHFARSFGLVQLAVEHEGHEPSVGSLHKVISESRSRNIKILIIQPGAIEENAKVVAEAISGKMELVDPLQRNWFASMQLAGQIIKAGLGQ